ncbi:MAG: hypothetical protein GXO25_06830 [Euryarchaeota archaeon]|nr:hypothetical protein [Euryarchaeota archaeon]
MEKVNVKRFEAIEEIIGANVMKDIIDAFERKLNLIDKISNMNLPVSDWDDMEREIMEGATE